VNQFWAGGVGFAGFFLSNHAVVASLTPTRNQETYHKLSLSYLGTLHPCNKQSTLLSCRNWSDSSVYEKYCEKKIPMMAMFAGHTLK